MLAGEIPETVIASGINIIKVDDRPAEAYVFSFPQYRLDAPCRTFRTGVIERSDPEFQNQLTGFSRLEIIRVCGIGIGELLDPWLTSPGKTPVLPLSRSVDMVILGMNAVVVEISIPGIVKIRVWMKLFDEGTSGLIAINYYLENIMVKVCPRKIPVIVISFIEEIEPVQAFYPAYFNLYIEI
jgi:hypothetical protein